MCAGGCPRSRVRLWVAALAWAAACARELDPATCARRFDVQPDKIIRTEESQDMGARYLSELDVGARDECLRLCCETDRCDVFVYEEKNPGNCYLFACGPPEDFRCKFTAHGNFSSGVLALSRRLAELQDVERLHRHDADNDLLDLRKAATTPGPASAPARAHTTPPPTFRPTATSRRCSRYQFECRSGGECVAVYNACDGVPQCADGSDEAPELGCPASPAPAPAFSFAERTPRPPSPPAPPRPAPHHLLPQPRDYAPSKDSGESPEGARWPHRLVQAQPATYPESGPSSHIFSHKGGLVQDVQDADGSGGAGAGPFAPFEPAAAGVWPRRPWTHDAGLGLESGGSMGVRWGGGEFPRYEWAASAPDPRRAWPVPPPPPPAPPQPPPPQIPLGQETSANGYGAKTMPETAAYSEQRHALHDGPKKGFDLMKNEPPMAPPAAAESPPPDAAPATPPHVPAPSLAPAARGNDNKASHRTPQQQRKARSTSHQKSVEKRKERRGKTDRILIKASSSIQEAEAAAAAAAAATARAAGAGALLDEHDGLSESPPAAVLLLVLGMAMTSALGVLVACRWRGARRRGRRRGPFAHDADYLVNGMYL